MYKSIIILLFLFVHLPLLGQAPQNDDCNSAFELKIPQNGFGYGTISGAKSDITHATREIGETCAQPLADVGNCDKSVWYKFYIPTTRNVGVKLTQTDSAIPQIFSGIGIYKIKGCGFVITDISNQLQPIAKFGLSGNSCLTEGYYLIQVGAKNKSAGELWIELQVARPQTDDYDDLLTLYNFPFLSGATQASQYFDMRCASLSFEEANALKDTSITKSVWFSYTIDANANEQILRLSGGGYNLKYRMFYDIVTIDSINSKKPFIELNYQGVLYKNLCYTNFSKKLIFQVIGTNDATNLNVNYSKNTIPRDLWSFPQTNEYKKISVNGSYSLTHTFTCEGLMSNHACKNVIGEQFVKQSRYKDQNGNYLKDTFKYAGYGIIEVEESGLLRIRNNENTSNSNQLYIKLFKGDIRNSCNVTFLTDTMFYRNSTLKSCVTPGIYTYIISSKEPSAIYNVNYLIYLNEVKTYVKYSHPSIARKLPDYDPLERKTFISDWADYSNRDTILKVDNKTYEGRMTYSEIDITNTGEMELFIEGDGHILLFSGHVSKGNISLLQNIDYTELYRRVEFVKYDHYKYKKCFYLNKGKYTIVSFLMKGYQKLNEILPCEFLSNRIVLRALPMCLPNNNIEPNLAYKLNDNLGVFSPTSTADGMNFLHELRMCIDCKSNSSFKPKLSCSNLKYVNENTNFAYYTFYMEKAGSMYSEYNFELYKGNVLLDTNIVKDTSLIVHPCENGTLICNLEGGRFYTIVIINPYNNSGNRHLKFAEHIKSVNDFAANAFDLGDVSSIVSSKGEYITCHTGTSSTDPYVYKNPNSKNDLFPMKYLDSLNFRRLLDVQSNIWYTFTVSGNSNYKIDLSSSDMQSDLVVYLMRYTGKYEKDFNVFKQNGFDSTLKQMELVTSRNINSWRNQEFNNYGCKANRYFLIVSRRSIYYNLTKTVKVNISSSTIPSTDLGDQCNNAASLNVNQAKLYKVSVDNTCHTFGGSAFEEVFEPNVKTSWIKISAIGLQKFDLGIRNSKGAGVLKYVVYGGNCGALTKIGQANDRFAYFTLSCMGAGDYYIQVFSNDAIADLVEFEIQISNGANLVCKSYDFKEPLAQFKINGGCQHDDTLRFVNFSTNGEDIEYTWRLNGNPFSSFRSPILNRRQSEILDSNKVQLIVRNKVIDLSDTFEYFYIRDTTIYKFKATGPTWYKCNDTSNVYVSTDYPHKINYSWSDIYGNTFSYYPYYRMSYFTKLIVDGVSDNCVFQDSIELHVINTLNKFKDTSVCASSPYKIFNNSSNFWYVIVDDNYMQISPGESYTFTESGSYVIYYYIDNCGYRDSMDVYVKPGPALLAYNKDIYVCNKDTLHLVFNDIKGPKYTWSNGDTGHYTIVNRSAVYRLKGQLNECTKIQSTYNVSMDFLDTNILRDTIVCFDTEMDLKSPYPPQFNIVHQEPSELLINVRNGFKRLLKVSRGLCAFTDTSYVSIYPRNGAVVDTFLCSQSFLFEMQLNAREALLYNWYENNHSGRYFTAQKYGYYPVSRVDLNGCLDTIHFNVITDCEFVVYVPNVFTPNNDLLNESFGPIISGKYTHFTMQIYNRWGEQVFDTKQSQNWDAIYSGSTVQQGVYTYLIVVYDKNGKPYTFRGTLSVLR